MKSMSCQSCFRAKYLRSDLKQVVLSRPTSLEDYPVPLIEGDKSRFKKRSTCGKSILIGEIL